MAAAPTASAAFFKRGQQASLLLLTLGESKLLCFDFLHAQPQRRQLFFAPREHQIRLRSPQLPRSRLRLLL
jgi:hypothetical protein